MALTSYTTSQGLLNKSIEKSKPTEYYSVIAQTKYPELRLKLDKLKAQYMQYLDALPLTQEEEHLEEIEHFVKVNPSGSKVNSAEKLRRIRATERMSMDRKIPKEILNLITDSVAEGKEYNELMSLPVFIKALTYFKMI